MDGKIGSEVARGQGTERSMRERAGKVLVGGE